MYTSFLLGVLAVYRWLADLTPLELMLLLPGLYWGLAMLATGLVAALKWLIIGRYRPRVEPMWSFFVWRTELITALYENVAVPLLLRLVYGHAAARAAVAAVWRARRPARLFGYNLPHGIRSSARGSRRDDRIGDIAPNPFVRGSRDEDVAREGWDGLCSRSALGGAL